MPFRMGRAFSQALRFPDASTTGPAAAGFTLSPNAATSIAATGPWPGWVQVQGDGSLLITGQNFNSGSTLTVNATVRVVFLGCQFTPAATFYAVIAGGGATGPFEFRYCTAAAVDSTVANAVNYAFPLPDGTDATHRSVVDHCNLYWFSAQPVIAVNHCLVSNNYIHDIVAVSGNHTEPVYLGTAGGGGTNTDVTVSNNTLLTGIPSSATAALYMDAHGNNYSNYTITGNYLAGGSYAVYLGQFTGFTITNLVVTGNYFSTVYYQNSGVFGYANNAPTWGSGGNTWSNNTWWDGPLRGTTLAAP